MGGRRLALVSTGWRSERSMERIVRIAGAALVVAIAPFVIVGWSNGTPFLIGLVAGAAVWVVGAVIMVVIYRALVLPEDQNPESRAED